MRFLLGAITVCSLLVSGCAPVDPGGQFAPEPPLLTSTAPSDSMPAFLDEPQGEEDIVESDALASGVDVESLRYQGKVGDESIYLAVLPGSNIVQIVTGIPEKDQWGWGGSLGNSVLGSTSVDGTHVQYLPQGTADLPEGWEAFSDWLATPSAPGSSE